MMDTILAIDDEPIRYHKLAELARERGINLVVTCQQAEYEFYTECRAYRIVGVCLDHDMPFQNGEHFAKDLAMYGYPVVVVSNNHGAAARCRDILEEGATPVTVAPASTDSWWPERILEWFAKHPRKATE
jgi:DNA-binding NarL/FixJ family response regulator